MFLGFVLFPLLILPSESTSPLSYYKVIYGWKELNYKFPSVQTRSRLLESGEFIPENNVPTGIKISGSRMFLTVPRWRQGVPASLNYVDFNPTGSDPPAEVSSETGNGPLLIPYPSWEMNQLGNCAAFQYVQSMEIDQFNRMWVVDVGRTGIFTDKGENKCPPKLVLIDLDKDEVLRKFEFPADVVSPTGNFLNDLAVGCGSREDCYVYITDALEAKIVVYSFRENRSWAVSHGSSMRAQKDASIIPILGKNYTFSTSVDGIALSPLSSNFDRLYYCPLSSYNLYSVSTQTLKRAINGLTLENSEVRDHGRKSSQSDGLAMDSKGLLFYGLLGSNAIAYFNTSANSKLDGNEVLLIQNDVDLQWPDTLAFDTRGYLYTLSNRLQRFRDNGYDFGEINFRVASVYIGSKSYMFPANQHLYPGGAISNANIDATPMTNLDVTSTTAGSSLGGKGQDDGPDEPGHDLDDEKHRYETEKDGGSSTSRSALNQAEDSKNNGSVKLDVYTGTFILVLAVYVFHPAI